MKHRISAGGIVIIKNQVLLVRHFIEGAYDFYVAPGGGLELTEDILKAAEREVSEETGLVVRAIKPIYLEQFYQPDQLHMKTWVLCEYLTGEISTTAPEATREHIVEASLFSEKLIKEQTKPVFPDVLLSDFWRDRKNGFPDFRYLGNRAMEFY